MKYSVNQRVKIVREAQGMTQGAFAASLNIAQSILSKIEKGHRAASVELLVNICLIHNVVGNWMLLGQGPMFKNGEEIISQEAKITELIRDIELLKSMPRVTLVDSTDSEKLEKGLAAFANYIEKLKNKQAKPTKGNNKN